MFQLHERTVLIGFLFAFIGTLLFSFKSIFIKLAYAQGLNTDSVLMLRMAISLPIYLGIMVVLLGRKEIKKQAIKDNILLIIFLGFIGYFLASWLNLKGLEYISASLERLTLFTYPIFTALLGAMFFATPLNRKIIISLVLTYLGLWVVFSQELEVSGDKTLTGMMFVVLSALSFSFYVLLGKKVIHQLGSIWFTTIAMSISSLFALVFYSITLDFSINSVSQEAWLWVFMLAIFSTVLPSFLISEAISRIGPAQTGVVGTVGPLFTIILAVFILQEVFSIYHAIGCVLVMTGVLILTIKK